MGLFDQAAPQTGLYGGGQAMMPPAPQQGAAPDYMAALAALLQKLGLGQPGMGGMTGGNMQMADATNPHVMTPGAIPGFAGSRAGPPMQPLPSLDRNIFPDPLRNNTLYPRS